MARRGYLSELRRCVVDWVEGGRRVSEIAADFEVSEQTICSWRRQARVDRHGRRVVKHPFQKPRRAQQQKAQQRQPAEQQDGQQDGAVPAEAGIGHLLHVLLGQQFLVLVQDVLQVIPVGVEKGRIVGAAGQEIVLDVIMDIKSSGEQIEFLVLQRLQHAGADAGFGDDIGQRDAARFTLLA